MEYWGLLVHEPSIVSWAMMLCFAVLCIPSVQIQMRGPRLSDGVTLKSLKSETFVVRDF